jgi:hypothetical protein
MSVNRSILALLAALAIGAGAYLAAGASGKAQDGAPSSHTQHGGAAGSVVPTLPGQDAFGAIQEIVRILEADSNTDWSKINLASLREHLVDMHEVTLRATTIEQPVENGLQVDVTGAGRTLDAIRRMLPAHGRELNGLSDWRASTETIAGGVRLTATSNTPAQVAHIRGLGFIGLMVSGSHHQLHHLAMARGKHIHQ